jgi:hypothetical protein
LVGALFIKWLGAQIINGLGVVWVVVNSAVVAIGARFIVLMELISADPEPKLMTTCPLNIAPEKNPCGSRGR